MAWVSHSRGRSCASHLSEARESRPLTKESLLGCLGIHNVQNKMVKWQERPNFEPCPRLRPSSVTLGSDLYGSQQQVPGTQLGDEASTTSRSHCGDRVHGENVLGWTGAWLGVKA